MTIIITIHPVGNINIAANFHGKLAKFHRTKYVSLLVVLLQVITEVIRTKCLGTMNVMNAFKAIHLKAVKMFHSGPKW